MSGYDYSQEDANEMLEAADKRIAALAAENAEMLKNGFATAIDIIEIHTLKTRIAALEVSRAELLDWAQHWAKYKVPGESPQDQGWRLAAQEVLQKLRASQAETNRNQAGTAPSDAGVLAPTPRGSLPNSLGASLENRGNES